MAKRGDAKAGADNPLKLDGQAWNKALVMNIFCERMRNSSLSNRKLLAEPWQGYPLPDYETIRLWMQADPALLKMYDDGKRWQMLYMAEEVREIADDGSNDYMERLGRDQQPIGWQLNGEHVQRSRLRVDTRKWLMSKLFPHQFGDKQEVEHKGALTVTISKEDAGVL